MKVVKIIFTAWCILMVSCMSKCTYDTIKWCNSRPGCKCEICDHKP